ncbi:gliding motility lipoprotein GldH [Bacteroidales bacterium OttesenSCG-928-K22]|nr:gliding motility lipoprotein GldH [Bacteroidales bacterium OttesenSCG-928-L14]MDL2240225.1 gliding motility lipoprotein GldH [Bacteroidales bacterium OttesenSCG-928-K22]
MINRKIIFVITLFLVLCFGACNKKYVTNNYCEIPKEGWSYSDTLNYQFKIDDVNTKHSIFLNIIHNNDYKYRNLYLFTQLYDPDSVLTCDTIQFLLTDPSGQLLGRGIGETKEAKFILADNINFSKQGDYSLRIIQGMRDDYLFGIEKIGFVISK